MGNCFLKRANNTFTLRTSRLRYLRDLTNVVKVIQKNHFKFFATGTHENPAHKNLARRINRLFINVYYQLS